MVSPVFILAGEPSGDQLAARIMDAVEARFGRQAWFGVGGPLMEQRELVSYADMTQLSVMGFRSAVTGYPKLSALANALVNSIIESRPRAVITVDAKGFSFQLAARLKKRMALEGWSAPVIHVVAPTVWAWGAWRAKSVARVVDKLLCLFPFEIDYFRPHGLDARFIGHPEAFNANLCYHGKNSSAKKRLLLLPGSRRSEIRRVLPVMRDAYGLVQASGKVSAYLVTLPHLCAEVEVIVGNNSNIKVVSGHEHFYRHLQKADAMMAASGTVTLQTALAGVPGVACYRTSALSALIGRRLVRMDRVILPNFLLDREVYPFLFQETATPAALAGHIKDILFNDGEIKAQKNALRNASKLRSLLRGGSSDFETLVADALEPHF